MTDDDDDDDGDDDDGDDDVGWRSGDDSTTYANTYIQSSDETVETPPSVSRHVTIISESQREGSHLSRPRLPRPCPP